MWRERNSDVRSTSGVRARTMFGRQEAWVGCGDQGGCEQAKGGLG